MRLAAAAALVGLVSCGAVGAAAAQAPSQPQPQPPAAFPVCATTVCRDKAVSVAVFSEPTRYQLVGVTKAPYVLPGNALLVFPGETVAFQLTVEGDKVSAIKFLKRYAPTMPAMVQQGQTLTVNVDDAALPKLPAADERESLASFPPNTLLVSYGQMKGVTGMSLRLVHNAPVMVKVDAILALIKPVGGYDQRPTSTCPMRPNVLLFERWPDVLGPMILTKPRVLPEGATLTCS